MKSSLSKINIVLRAIMELGIITALCYWGIHTGKSSSTKIVLGVSSPIIMFGFWGLVDFHNSGRYSEILRLVQELVISALAAIALYISGLYFLAFFLASLSIVHHMLTYAIGEKLLK